jgi:hypothetical protein
MVPSDITIGKEQLNVLAYADVIVLTGKNEIGMGPYINQGKTKYMIAEWKKKFKTK